MHKNILKGATQWLFHIFRNARTLLETIFEALIVLDFFWFKWILDRKTVNTSHLLLWLIISIFLIGFIVYLKYVWHQRRTTSENRLRYCLLNLRTIFNTNAQKLYDMTDAVVKRCNRLENDEIPSTQIRCNSKRYVQHTKQQIVEMIYKQLVAGVPLMSARYCVALFEMDVDGVMRIKNFANTENYRPRIVSQGQGFKLKEGLAGKAWFYKNPMFVANVSEYLYYVQTYNLIESSLFKPRDDYTHYKIESIVCFPIIIRREGCESVKGLISIDCDKKNIFDLSDTIAHSRLRKEIYPYIRFLGWVYGTTDFFKTVLDTDLESCDCPLCLTGNH